MIQKNIIILEFDKEINSNYQGGITPLFGGKSNFQIRIRCCSPLYTKYYCDVRIV